MVNDGFIDLPAHVNEYSTAEALQNAVLIIPRRDYLGTSPKLGALERMWSVLPKLEKLKLWKGPKYTRG